MTVISQVGISGAGIMRGIGKLFKGGKKAAPEPEAPKPEAPKRAKEADPKETQALEVSEELESAPPPDILTAGRPDDRKGINLGHWSDNPRTQQIVHFMDQVQNRFEAHPDRVVKTNMESLEKSKQIEVISGVLKKDANEKWSTEEILALGGHIEDASIELSRVTDDLNLRLQEGGQVSDEEMAEFLAVEDQMNSFLDLYIGEAAHAGRTLQVYNAMNQVSSRAQYFKGLKNTLDSKGGRVPVTERIRAYSDNKGDFKKNLKTSKGTLGQRTVKQLFKYRYNAMLSSVRTHAANITGSGFVTLNENLVIKPLTVAFNKAEQGVRKITPGLSPMSADDAMVWREAWAVDKAALNGFAIGVEGFGKIIRGEVIPDGKFMNEIGTRYDVNDVPNSIAGRIGTLPVRMLEAEDAIFRSGNYEMELSRLAHRRSRNLSESPAEARAMYNDLMTNPSEDMIAGANEFAKYSVFANDPNMYSKMFGAVAHAAATAQQRWAPFQALIPFVKTPANIMAYTRNHTVPWASSTFYKDIASNNPVRRAEAMARFTAAAGIMMLARPLWEEGRITGVGHPNSSSRRAAIQTGIMPNSIKLSEDGDWISLNRLDPAGMSLGLIATAFDYMDAAPDGEVVGPLLDAIISSSELMLDRSMLATSSDLLSIIQGTASSAKKGDVAGALAAIPAVLQPGILRDVRQVTDPVKRDMTVDPNTAVGGWQRIDKRFRNAWPWASETLPPKRDWRGDIKMSQGAWYVRGLIPVQVNKEMKDQASKALLHFGVSVTSADSNFTLPGVGLDLNLLNIDDGKGFALNKLQENIGKARSKLLDDLVTGSTFKELWKETIKDGRIVDQQKYELAQDMLSKMLSAGRRIGKYRFLEWLDGRTTIPGPDDTEIPVAEVFNMSDYPGIDQEFLSGDAPDTDIYQRRGHSILPSQGTVEF